MTTRFPHLPNVKLTKQLLPQKHSLCRRVQSVASESRASPATTINSSRPHFPQKSYFTTASTNHTLRIPAKMGTRVLPVNPQGLGNISFKQSGDLIDEWDLEYSEGEDYKRLSQAAQALRNTDVPVAFPTETVYGLAADATRSSAVKAIFAAKGRPADNPLIVHFHSLPQLRALLRGEAPGQEVDSQDKDLIPSIYHPLVERFWPGPLTIILPAPQSQVLAPEVTAGLSTFGARMPRSILALALLRLCGRPLAAPSANASTRPSPTAAEHVFDDLEGRIETIIDGGPCEVGVESTVVDGLSSPPTILRPGGVTVEQLRQCPGWEDVVVGYKDAQERGADAPRAPGMKYRHYSPKAEVVLFEAGSAGPSIDEIKARGKVGVIRTGCWKAALGLEARREDSKLVNGDNNKDTLCDPAFGATNGAQPRLSNLLLSLVQHQIPHADLYLADSPDLSVWDINLGSKTEDVARGLFSALRELDKKGVEIIYVEGIDDRVGDDIAAAVMNRLRKAAEIRT